MSGPTGFQGGDVVTFRLNGEVLAVSANRLREVLEPVGTTRVPGAPEFVRGLINVRGSVVPLADLRVPLRMPRAELGIESRILVIELPLGGQDTVVGIVADSVHEVTRIEADALEQTPPVGTRWPPRYVAAIGRWAGEFVTIPNLPVIFSEFLSGQISRSSNPGASAAGHIPEPEAIQCD